MAAKQAYFQPTSRAFHSTVVINNSIYAWGGMPRELPDAHDNAKKRKILSPVMIFDVANGKWRDKLTVGAAPLGVVNYACTSIKNRICFFGGYCGHKGCYHNSLCELDTDSLQWTEISPTADREGLPMKKYGCGMVSFTCDNEDIALIVGGTGIATKTPQPNAMYIARDDSAIITNEHHMYNFSTAEWTIPTVSGDCPPPSTSFTFTQLSNNTAVAFTRDFHVNGREIGCTNSVYSTEVTKNTVHWVKLAKPDDPTIPWPEGRRGQAAVVIRDPLLGHQRTVMVVTGGIRHDNTNINDSYIYQYTTKNWKRLNLPNSVTDRHGHSLSVVTISSHCVWLVTFGGRNSQKALCDTNIVELVYSNNIWTVGELLTPAELSNTQQYQQLLWRRVREGQEITRERNLLYQRLHQNIQQALQKQREKNAQTQLELRESEEKVEKLKQENLELSNIRKNSVCSTPPVEHWVVTRKEITMTHKILGKGGYGEVKVARFRGLRVAAKCLHEIILSPYNHQLFIREMEMASRIRHPNLLQFIGATKEGSPIILSELMSTSLRKELEKAPLTRPQILCISRDIASALNYLHLWVPSPIIHRDVSSPNVLLEPLAENIWKAKLSDYGSANLLQQISSTSVTPGNPFYSAPEAHYPQDHSPAMDVYSFGVLLMEMVLCRQPDRTPVEGLYPTIECPFFKDIVARCTTASHPSRPSIGSILEQLNN